jgi:hypothetical protein
MNVVDRLRRVARRLDEAIDRADAVVWQAERRQAWREKHTAPDETTAAREARRRDALDQWRRERGQ